MNRRSRRTRRTRRTIRRGGGRVGKHAKPKRKSSKKKKSPKKNTGQKPSQAVIKKAVKELMKACQKAEDDNGPDGVNAMGNRFDCNTDISPKMRTALHGADAKQANSALKKVKSKTAAYKRAVKSGNIHDLP